MVIITHDNMDMWQARLLYALKREGRLFFSGQPYGSSWWLDAVDLQVSNPRWPTWVERFGCWPLSEQSGFSYERDGDRATMCTPLWRAIAWLGQLPRGYSRIIYWEGEQWSWPGT